LSHTRFRNRLLALMPPQDLALLAEGLIPVELPRSFVLVEADHIIDYVYFFETGIGSVIASSPEGQEAEAGLFGHEGVAPTAAVLGSDRSANSVIIQVMGRGHRIELVAFQQILDKSATVRSLVTRYAQVMHVQTSFTALSNAVHAIDERLARWLLMCHDRVENDEIALTHDFISIMLAVRRPSVTTALHVLEGNGFIRSERGYITIRNRKGLEEFASDAYGKPEAEYRRLIGPMD
jgi:CRP-like cAMP-binding protein